MSTSRSERVLCKESDLFGERGRLPAEEKWANFERKESITATSNGNSYKKIGRAFYPRHGDHSKDLCLPN